MIWEVHMKGIILAGGSGTNFIRHVAGKPMK